MRRTRVRGDHWLRGLGLVVALAACGRVQRDAGGVAVSSGSGASSATAGGAGSGAAGGIAMAGRESGGGVSGGGVSGGGVSGGGVSGGGVSGGGVSGGGVSGGGASGGCMNGGGGVSDGGVSGNGGTGTPMGGFGGRCLPGGNGNLTGACTSEGSLCAGTVCHDEESGSSYASLCCNGQWLAINPDAVLPDGGAPACPTSIGPGDPFPCGTAGLTCVAGQSYCLNRYAGNSPAEASCQPLCAAGDCSCFCASADGCTFDPPDKQCPQDTCTCGAAYDALGLPQAATVGVTCSYEFRPQLGCSRQTDYDNTCQAFSGKAAYVCWGTDTPCPSCVRNSGVDGSSCGIHSAAYCCPN
jgi:hypothetical protein